MNFDSYFSYFLSLRCILHPLSYIYFILKYLYFFFIANTSTFAIIFNRTPSKFESLGGKNLNFKRPYTR